MSISSRNLFIDSVKRLKQQSIQSGNNTQEIKHEANKAITHFSEMKDQNISDFDQLKFIMLTLAFNQETNSLLISTMNDLFGSDDAKKNIAGRVVLELRKLEKYLGTIQDITTYKQEINFLIIMLNFAINNFNSNTIYNSALRNFLNREDGKSILSSYVNIFSLKFSHAKDNSSKLESIDTGDTEDEKKIFGLHNKSNQ